VARRIPLPRASKGKLARPAAWSRDPWEGLFRTETGDFGGRARSATLPARWRRPPADAGEDRVTPGNYLRRGGTNAGQFRFLGCDQPSSKRTEHIFERWMRGAIAASYAGRHRIARHISSRRRALPEQREKPRHAKRRAASARASATKSGARGSKKYWSAGVTERSNALDLEADVFTLDDPVAIARSLKRSAEASERRKAPPFRSAMSMLVFYINRAGKGLSEKRRRVLERAKDELRRAFDRS